MSRLLPERPVTGALNNALTADKNVVLTAMGDVVRERLDKSLESIATAKASWLSRPTQRFSIPPARQ